MTSNSRRHIRLRKAELTRKVNKGLLPKQALNPPEFRIIAEGFEEGQLKYHIDGKHVDKTFYFYEMERLDFDRGNQKFDIKGFRKP